MTAKHGPCILRFALAGIAACLLLAGCGERGGSLFSKTHLVLVSGSENEELEPILRRFARENRVDLDVQYKGSVDIMLDMEAGAAMEADLVWPANSLWISLGDAQRVIRHADSIMNSPVVFGIKKSVAAKLGWIGKPVTMADILAAVEAGQLRFAMTSATQSNSGASAYLGFLHALAGSPDVLTHAHLADPAVQEKVRKLLSGVHRSSGSSGWLKDMFIQRYDQLDGMVNYESMVIEANQALVAMNREPLVAIYPRDGMMVSDSPLAFVDKKDAAREEVFRKLVAYLKTEAVQKEILAKGRRTGLAGLDIKSVDTSLFNRDWGIDVSRVIASIPVPAPEVLREALDLYQAGGLRKPSLTAYVLDFSGSMEGQGESELKSAMALLLDPDQSRRYWLQPSARDIHIVIPFNSAPQAALRAEGNEPEKLRQLLTGVQALRAAGGTDMYSALASARAEIVRTSDSDRYFTAIILMTDGKSQGTIEAFHKGAQGRPITEIPVFSITFGQADDTQLKTVSDETGGRIFHGKADLRKAFRNAKGYN